MQDKEEEAGGGGGGEGGGGGVGHDGRQLDSNHGGRTFQKYSNSERETVHGLRREGSDLCCRLLCTCCTCVWQMLQFVMVAVCYGVLQRVADYLVLANSPSQPHLT